MANQFEDTFKKAVEAANAVGNIAAMPKGASYTPEQMKAIEELFKHTPVGITATLSAANMMNAPEALLGELNRDTAPIPKQEHASKRSNEL